MSAPDQEAEGWLEHLLDGHQVRLRGFIARYIDNRDELMDLVQETFLDAWQARERLDHDRDPWPWLRTIAYRRVVDHLRRNRYRRPEHLRVLDDMLIDEAGSVAQDQDDLLERLQRCLEAVDDRHRRLLGLRFHSGLPLAEIASRLGEAEGTVTMRIFRLCERLRECVKRAAV